VEPEANGRDSKFTFCHAHFKKDHEKRFVFFHTVYTGGHIERHRQFSDLTFWSVAD